MGIVIPARLRAFVLPLAAGLCALLLSSGSAFAQAPLPEAKKDVAGGDVSGKYKPGFFAQGDIGTFFTLGGGKGNSNAQLYAGFEFGYSMEIIKDAALLSLGVWYAIASSDKNPSTNDGRKINTENYSLNIINFGAKYSHLVFQQRLAVSGRVSGGVVIAQPKTTTDEGSILYDVTIGAGLDYYTRIPNLAVGVELGVPLVFPTGIFGLAVYPMVKYTF